MFPKLHLKLCVFLSLTAVLTSMTSLLGCGGRPKAEASTQMPPSPSPSPSPGASIAPGTPAGAKTISHIEDLGNWQWCTKRLNGTACASGAGNATSSMVPHQSSPSRDGSSARFNISGPTGYSNALWWNSVANDSSVSHFTYDLWFYIDNPAVSEALEFDVNQSFGGIRYTWGTECAFKDSHRWDIWDAAGFKWVHTNLPCNPFSGNSWHHIVWQFERVNHQMHYVSLSVDGSTMPVDIYKDPQTNWNFDDINVAFQLDGDITQHPYNVWLDQVNLTMW